MKRIAPDHIINVAALCLAVMALLLSLHSNYLSQEANNIAQTANEIASASNAAKLTLMDRDDSFVYIQLTGCRYSVSNLTRYVLRKTVNDKITITNQGGRNSSLVRVMFLEGDVSYYRGKIFDVGSAYDREPLELPLNIDAGIAKVWFLSASDDSPYDTKQEALEAVSRTQVEALWQLYFSDGSVLSDIPSKVMITVDPDLDQALDRECNA